MKVLQPSHDNDSVVSYRNSPSESEYTMSKSSPNIHVMQHESVGIRIDYFLKIADDYTGDIESPIGFVCRVGDSVTKVTDYGFASTIRYASVDDAVAIFANERESFRAWWNATRFEMED